MVLSILILFAMSISAINATRQFYLTSEGEAHSFYSRNKRGARLLQESPTPEPAPLSSVETTASLTPPTTASPTASSASSETSSGTPSLTPSTSPAPALLPPQLALLWGYDPVNPIFIGGVVGGVVVLALAGTAYKRAHLWCAARDAARRRGGLPRGRRAARSIAGASARAPKIEMRTAAREVRGGEGLAVGGAGALPL